MKCIHKHTNIKSNNKDEFEKIRAELSAYGTEYPEMKMMDMCLWQVTFENDTDENKKEMGV